MLVGRTVGLRAVERNDLPQLLEWRNNPRFRQFFREFRELNMEKQIQWYEQVVLADLNTFMFSIVELQNSRLIGACGLCYIRWNDRNADFSIYIGADNLYIDDKYAPDAANILILYAFNELCLHRLWAEIYDFDEAKIGLFQNLGFKIDGHHRETHWAEGRWCDSLFYSLLKKDFTY
jgi:RimJ/RimL family protein N-acetyltransferase